MAKTPINRPQWQRTAAPPHTPNAAPPTDGIMRERSIHTQQNKEGVEGNVGDRKREMQNGKSIWKTGSELHGYGAVFSLEAERKRAMKWGASRRLIDELETDRMVKAVDKI